jgi:type III secretory pathway component EscS
MNLRVAFAQSRKAVAAAVTVGVMVLLRKAGVELDNGTVQFLVESGITSLVVWLVPNAEKLVY